MTDTTPLETVLKRDRLIVMVGLATVVALAAVYTVAGVGMSMSALSMTGMAVEMPGMMMEPAVWSAPYALLVFLMWWVMMIAMMVPSAAPMILLHASLARKRKTARSPYGAVSCFVAGYLAVWGGFSLVAMALQWGARAGRHDDGHDGDRQRTACRHGAACRWPLPVDAAQGDLPQTLPSSHVFFLLHHWKPGAVGAFRMGAEHGAYCLGCCWFLMALLFVGGIMNLFWIAGIAIYVAVEKARRRTPPTDHRHRYSPCPLRRLADGGALSGRLRAGPDLLPRPRLFIPDDTAFFDADAG
ncbi:DUF2182 domain-containing protein [Roseibium salinum]|nr:DUF2182 domain-containing protein [Roseibium salinum]